MFKVIPLNNKIPLIQNWEQEATADPVKIQAWQNYFNGKLTRFGIPTGLVNDILVLDVDAKDGGLETIKNYQIPNTMSQRTQSGGIHYIFRYPKDGKQYGNRTKFIPGCDLRGIGGQIVYYGTDQTPIAEAPQWLLDGAIKSTHDHTGQPVQVAPTVAEGIIQKCLNTIVQAPQGERNNVLNTESFKVGQLVKAGSVTREYAERALLGAAHHIGLPQDESWATISSALKGSDNKPLTTPFSEPVAIGLPAVTVPERWTPKHFTLDDLMNTSKLKKPQLFKDWSTEDIHITTADGGTGKTTLKLFEAICLALGESFLGFPCVAPGKTLFITGEDTAGKLGAMIGAITRQMGLLSDSAKLNTILSSIVVKKDSDLCLINKDRQGFLHPNQVAFNSIMEAVHDVQPKMIVFDPISSFWGSEAALNDMAKAVSRFMGRLVEESKACVEMVNHMGKQSSKQKDMSQFAGRGGTGLPSHSRVSRVLRTLPSEEYADMTGKELGNDQSAIVCNVGKFTDGSPLIDKPFIILRDGFLFSREILSASKARDLEKDISHQDRVMKFVKECRSNGKYPSKALIIAHFVTCGDPIPETKIRHALQMLEFNGDSGTGLKTIENPDVGAGGKVYVLIGEDGNEA